MGPGLASTVASVGLFGTALLAQVSTRGVVETFPTLGITLERPRNYEAVPVPPDEPWIVLHYVEELDAHTDRTHRPAFKIVVVPRPADGAGPTPGADGAAPIVDLETYLALEWPYWSLGEREAIGRADPPARHAILRPAEVGTLGWTGYVYALETPTRTVALIGVCGGRDADEHRRLWRRTAESLVLGEPRPEATDTRRLRLDYERSRFGSIDERIAVRQRLVEGWQATDTPHYLVVHHVDDQPLVRRVCRDVETLRCAYAELFPEPDGPAKGTAPGFTTVRLCRDRQEYAQYGGIGWSEGSWRPEANELVLYQKFEGDYRGRVDYDGTLANLYHEAFHEYVHHAAGGLRPHPWFDEGFADYFSGARPSGGKVRRIEPDRERLAAVQTKLRRGTSVPWAEIVRWNEEEFYPAVMPEQHYPQAWSMAWFLATSRVVSRDERWSRIVPTYFDTLRRVYAEELAFAEHPEQTASKRRAELVSRDEAIGVALYGVDLDALERAWTVYVLSL